MRKLFLMLTIISFIACDSEDDDTNNLETAKVHFSFMHNWDEIVVTSSDFNTIQYTNANGEELSIERLRYLISNIVFTNETGEVTTLDGYNLVDLTNNDGLAYTPNFEAPQGTYSNLSFTFGFNNEDNLDGAYQDLNSASFNVPMMLGGGYHYMQLDGKYIDDANLETGFNYHAIRAVDNPGDNPTFPQDTFFQVDLGPVTITGDTTIEVKMNIAEWFKNPNTWNLNDLDTVLMPNSAAQIMMYDNGQAVFSLGEVTQ